MAAISVIVPVYKVEPYIRRCVDSVLAQSFQDFELILVDDGSPDRCGEICDEYARQDARIQVLHQQNGGLSAARNAGIDWTMSHSGSKWLTFIDSDDWVHPSYLQRLLDACLESGAGASTCLYTRVNQAGELLDPDSLPEPVTIFTYDQFFSTSGWGLTPYTAWGKLFPKSSFESIRFPVGKLNEDLFTTHRLLWGCGSIARVNTALYYYYQSASSIMRSAWTPKRLDEVEASRELVHFMEQKGCHSARKAAIRRMAWVLRMQLSQMGNSDEPEHSRYRKQLRREGRILLLTHPRTIPFYSNWEIYCSFFPIAAKSKNQRSNT